MTDPLVQLRVHGHNEDDGSMRAAQWRQDQEAGEVGVVLVSTAVVDPGAVVVHLHYTPDEEGRGGDVHVSTHQGMSVPLLLSIIIPKRKSGKIIKGFCIFCLTASH